MSERETTGAVGRDPQSEVGPEVAAQMLGFTVPRLLELLKVGAVPSRLQGTSPVIRVADLVDYREERERRRPAIREINQIVNETPDGWDS